MQKNRAATINAVLIFLCAARIGSTAACHLNISDIFQMILTVSAQGKAKLRTLVRVLSQARRDQNQKDTDPSFSANVFPYRITCYSAHTVHKTVQAEITIKA